MGVIIKIRNRLGFLLIALIAVAIIAFLFMDISSEGTALGGRPTNVGSVDGETISLQDFERRYQQTLDNYRANTGQRTLGEELTFSLRNDTWKEMVEQIILTGEYQRLGIRVTSDELLEMISGESPDPNIVQAFTNPETGQYNPQEVLNIIQNLDQDPTGEMRAQWIAFERFILQNRKREKYNNLIKHAVFVPEWQARFDHTIKNENVNFEFVYLPYNTLEDDEIDVSDRDLRNHINNNPKRYKTEATRSIDFVSFPIIPSKEDSLESKNWLLERKDDFKATNDDSTYIRLYSETAFNPAYLNINQISGKFTDTFFTMEPRQILGPYLENDKFVLAKLVDRKLIPDSVQARHIQLNVNTQEEFTTKRELADSLLAEIKDGASFSAIANDFSDDVFTTSQGGDLGWVMPGDQFATINDQLFFKREQGDIFIVTGQQGFHIIEITRAEPSTEAVKVAYLSRSIRAGSETERSAFSKASAFAGQNRTLEEFRENAPHEIKSANGLGQNDYMVPGIGVSREIVQWAFRSRLHEVSGAFSLDDSYVVAIVTASTRKGTAELDMVREQAKAAVILEKKGERLAERMNTLRGQHQSINQLANALEVDVKTATGLGYNENFLTGIGQEPRVVAFAAGMEPGNLSQAIIGNRGVFVISLISKQEAPSITDFTTQKQQIKTNINNRVDFNLLENLKETSNIVDNRHEFY
ncbi:MAG: hypothetical protein EA412_09765 [Chitinophagaceae bacterium]|nr:MAG: hypothetical protein EA412_09765 [Chitinophagaceae bacterium]